MGRRYLRLYGCNDRPFRLQQLLRELSAAFEAETLPRLRSAVLVTAPGDQHTFGVFILQEFFRRAGWDVPRRIYELGRRIA